MKFDALAVNTLKRQPGRPQIMEHWDVLTTSRHLETLMKLSVILVAYDMAREIPRTLESLSRPYQEGAENLEYEVLLLDNGSPVPLDEASWSGLDVPVKLIRIDDASTSPASAINRGLQLARGELVCLMIDGAHMLTPGVFRMALSAYQAFDNAVVAIRYFYLGVGEQTESVLHGYDQEAEDGLLGRIDWPSDGYRLFEIGTPLRSGAKRMTWFNRLAEANCLIMKRSFFQLQGGADERFDFPGGGFLNLDIFKRAVEAPEITPVQIIGEGSFHQLHGGTTTNPVSQEERREKLEKYREQYRDIRGHTDVMSKVSFTYMGHMPTQPSNISAVEKRRARLAGKPFE
ncbi:MAG: glycosyltransferase [Halieaceae bacterium]|nr:glycosyltransferase [Halieaceae bacterium]